jgi:ABC-type spermidine/putrescine transport system permease subunit II
VAADRRSAGFYALAAFFTVFVLFLYGPLSAIVILSFQGPDGGLTFPMNGFSTHWFAACSSSSGSATSRARFSVPSNSA